MNIEYTLTAQDLERIAEAEAIADEMAGEEDRMEARWALEDAAAAALAL